MRAEPNKLCAPLLPNSSTGDCSVAVGGECASAPLSQPSVAVPKPREPLLDNARALLIYLVVLYHCTCVYTTADRPDGTGPMAYWSGLLALLKPVVMPSFCLLSGHLSRPTLDLRRAAGLIQLLATWVIFQTAYFLMNLLSFRLADFPLEPFPMQVFNPQLQVVTWFIFSLALWRTALPMLVLLRAPLLASLLLGHAALFVDLGINYQNLFSFLPYFVAGHLLPASLWSQLARPAVRLPLAAFFVCVGICLLTFSGMGDSPSKPGPRFDAFFAQLALSYGCMNGVPPQKIDGVEQPICASARELLHRSCFYLVSLPLVAGFFCLLPRTRGFWSVPGYMSMYVYLLHPLVITNPAVMKFTFLWLSDEYGREVNVWSPATSGRALAFLPLAAAAVCVVLSTPLARWLFWPFVEPPTTALFRRGMERAMGGAAAGAELLHLRADADTQLGATPQAPVSAAQGALPA